MTGLKKMPVTATEQTNPATATRHHFISQNPDRPMRDRAARQVWLRVRRGQLKDLLERKPKYGAGKTVLWNGGVCTEPEAFLWSAEPADINTKTRFFCWWGGGARSKNAGGGVQTPEWSKSVFVAQCVGCSGRWFFDWPGHLPCCSIPPPINK